MQRLAVRRGAVAETLKTAFGAFDVRWALASIQCPTLILRRRDETAIDWRHSRYVADNVPAAQLVELAGDGPVFLGEVDEATDQIQEFLTGSRPPAPSDRVLATVLFTDIVGSTDRAAEIGDARWRELLAEHDQLVRRALDRFEGREVKTTGDGFLASFDGPARAIRCDSTSAAASR